VHQENLKVHKLGWLPLVSYWPIQLWRSIQYTAHTPGQTAKLRVNVRISPFTV